MAKIVDITDKLSFDGNPRLKIRDVELEINADAETVLKIMGIVADGVTARATVQMLDLLITGSSRKALDKLKLSFADFQIVVFAAMDLIIGGTDELGGAGPRTMT